MSDGGGNGAEGTVPLARLLAVAYRDLVDQLHERLRADGWDDVRPAYGFVLLATRAGSQSVTELATRLEVSKQAVSKLVESMVASGYLVYAAPGTDSRVKGVALSDRGRQLLAAVEAIHDDLEAGWAELIGGRSVEAMRRNLTTVVRARHDGELPTVRPPEGR